MELNKIYIASFERTKNVARETINLLESESQSEFQTVLINLLYEITREVDRLLNNYSDLTLLSLNLRNIFELYLTTRYVFDDKKAFASWLGQIHKDNVDVLEGFKSLLSKKNIKTDALDKQIELVDSALEDST